MRFAGVETYTKTYTVQPSKNALPAPVESVISSCIWRRWWFADGPGLSLSTGSLCAARRRPRHPGGVRRPCIRDGEGSARSSRGSECRRRTHPQVCSGATADGGRPTLIFLAHGTRSYSTAFTSWTPTAGGPPACPPPPVPRSIPALQRGFPRLPSMAENTSDSGRVRNVAFLQLCDEPEPWRLRCMNR